MFDTDDSAVAVAVTAGPPISTTCSRQIEGATTTLSRFAPDASADTPSSDQTFLAVQLATERLIDAANSDVVELVWPNPVPVDHVQLVLPDGTRIGVAPVDADQEVPGVSVNLFSGVHYFAVPADAGGTSRRPGDSAAWPNPLRPRPIPGGHRPCRRCRPCLAAGRACPGRPDPCPRPVGGHPVWATEAATGSVVCRRLFPGAG